MNPLTIIKTALTLKNLLKSPTTGGAAVAAAGGIALAQFQSEHDMWVYLITAIVSSVLFFINDRKESDE